MTNNDFPRLCGGTFFNLLLQAKKQRKNNRPQFESDDDGLTEYGMLEGLIKVFQPNYSVSNRHAFKKTVSNYKLCKPNSENSLPFSNAVDINNFDIAVKSCYPSILEHMRNFTEKFIDETKSEWLINSLLELIDSDKKISADKNFFILPDGNAVSKYEMINTMQFFLPSFLTGIFHYILSEKIENSVGLTTVDTWLSAKEKYKQRKFTSNIGTNIHRRIEIMTSTKMEENVGFAQNSQSVNAELIIDNKAEQKNYSSSNVSPQQNGHKSVVFNFTQSGDHNTQIGQVENYYNSERE